MKSWELLLLVFLASAPASTLGRLHGHGGDRALVLVDSPAVDALDTCVGDACEQRALRGEQQATPPEFEPTHEWQEILPNQPIPPV